MRRTVSREWRVAAPLTIAIASVLGISAFVFTAGNTVTSHSARAGTATVSGYEVRSSINYTFGGDGETLTGVQFELNKAATDVHVALTAGTPAPADWTDCGASHPGAPFGVTCTFGAPVPDGQGLKLSVAAVGGGTVRTGSQ